MAGLPITTLCYWNLREMDLFVRGARCYPHQSRRPAQSITRPSSILHSSARRSNVSIIPIRAQMSTGPVQLTSSPKWRCSTWRAIYDVLHLNSIPALQTLQCTSVGALAASTRVLPDGLRLPSGCPSQSSRSISSSWCIVCGAASVHRQWALSWRANHTPIKSRHRVSSGRKDAEAGR